MPRISSAVLALSCVAAMAATPAAANPGAFVASTGSDANTATGCPQANPCRTMAAAHSVVDPGGTILAMDGAGYGIVTITKSVTIAANPGFNAAMRNSVGSVITIATPGVAVILRGLNIDNNGAASFGINMTDGASLTVENCVISNFLTNGIFVNAPVAVRVSDSLVRGNGLDGIAVNGGATANVTRTKAQGNGRSGMIAETNTAVTTTLSVSDSDASGNQYGLVAFLSGGGTPRLAVSRTSATNNAAQGISTQGGGLISFGDTNVTGNGTGVANNGGTIESLGNNFVRQNGANTSGVIGAFSGI